MNLPYQVPDSDLTLNIAILLIILAHLSKTQRGKLLLNNERLKICFHLLKNPLILNKVLLSSGQLAARLESYDEYSIASISNNLDPLHDSRRVKTLLQRAAALNFINVEYRKSEGFVYELSQEGVVLVGKLKGVYFDSLRSYSQSLTQLNSLSIAKLNELIENNRGEIRGFY